jgi:hypothetical protein
MSIRLQPTNDQEAFDMVVRHLGTMPRRAMDESGSDCAYYNPDTGMRCAIGGILILETEYDLCEAEQLGGSVSRHIDAGDIVGDRRLDVRLLQKLQETHDSSYNWLDERDGRGFSGWEILRDVARDFGLHADVIEEARNAPIG